MLPKYARTTLQYLKYSKKRDIRLIDLIKNNVIYL